MNTSSFVITSRRLLIQQRTQRCKSSTELIEINETEQWTEIVKRRKNIAEDSEFVSFRFLIFVKTCSNMLVTESPWSKSMHNAYRFALNRTKPNYFTLQRPQNSSVLESSPTQFWFYLITVWTCTTNWIVLLFLLFFFFPFTRWHEMKNSTEARSCFEVNNCVWRWVLLLHHNYTLTKPI